jgi:hypothetical protein
MLTGWRAFALAGHDDAAGMSCCGGLEALDYRQLRSTKLLRVISFSNPSPSSLDSIVGAQSFSRAAWRVAYG